MPVESSHLVAARQRIAQAYAPDVFTAAGRSIIEELGHHLAAAQASKGSVLNWRSPGENDEDALALLSAPRPTDGAAFVNEVASMVRLTVARGQTLHDPRYIGHQVAPPLPIAGLFEAVSSVTNQGMAIYEMGPWATGVEDAMVQTLGQALGFPAGSFAGFITSGGSLATLTALLTARNVALEQAWRRGITAGGGAPPVMVAHSESHYCVTRAAGVLGIGSDHVIKVELDDRSRMNPQSLEVTLTELRRKGHPIVAVIASACSTRTGAFDPLPAISEVCKRHGVWLHVDAAHGGAACLSDRHRHLLQGIELADSVVWDAHKMLHVPALCTFVFYRDPRHRYCAFEQDAPYLYDPTAPFLADHDSGLKTVECTKRAAAFGLWAAWRLHGKQLFADIVESTFDMARRFHDLLAAADDFVALHEPMCNIQMFRHLPAALRDADAKTIGAFQLQLRRRVIESGRFYIVPGKWEGHGALRAVVMNPLTTEAHLKELLTTLREEGTKIIAGG